MQFTLNDVVLCLMALTVLLFIIIINAIIKERKLKKHLDNKVIYKMEAKK